MDNNKKGTQLQKDMQSLSMGWLYLVILIIIIVAIILLFKRG